MAAKKADPGARYNTRAKVFSQTLSQVFVDVDVQFITKVCQEKCAKGLLIDREGLNEIIYYLLEQGPNNLIAQPHRTRDQLIDVHEKYSYIIEVFPDIEPKYLMSYLLKHCINPEESQRNSQYFIRYFFENVDKKYSKVDPCIESMKINEQIMRLTTDFQIDEFLEHFPDPFTHFEDENRECSNNDVVLHYLKVHFNRHLVKTINRLYTKNKFNASLVAKALDKLQPDMKSTRVWEHKKLPVSSTKDLTILEELTFILNRNLIREHLDKSKKNERNLFEQLKKSNSLLKCECCFDEDCLPEKCSSCEKGHNFCYDCITRGTEAVLADGEGQVKCFVNCGGIFSVAKLQNVLPSQIFMAYLKKNQIAELTAANIEGLVVCPFCDFAVIPPEESRIFQCLNPDCMKESCRFCKEKNHVPLSCEEVAKEKNRSEADKARLLLEEKMTEALIRTCYNCGKKFFKEDGCNKMKCTCGAMMCFMCGQPVQNYQHFNPQNGIKTNLCPLWTDNKRMNAQAVVKVAEDVKNLIIQQNPNIDINMNALLPEVPAEAQGPHQTVRNANQLPAHLLKVVENIQPIMRFNSENQLENIP